MGLLVRTIATLFGLGYVPKIPGTVGSAVGLIGIWFLGADPVCQLIGIGVAVGLAFWSAGPAARLLGKTDPAPVVIDEVAGMMTALAFLPFSWPIYLTGFLLFRLLDILKPLGIRRLERLPGSWGIVLDDLAAGVVVNVLLRLFGA